MSAIATLIEQQQEVRPCVFGERAQELDTVVSRYLPMFYKRAYGRTYKRVQVSR